MRMMTAGCIVARVGGVVAFGLLVTAEAALEVDFVTSRGTITAVMEHVKTPKTVANLILLAQGTRAWVDPVTGRVLAGTFFNGQSFYQVVNNASVRTIGIGSPSGNDAFDPGYAFPDEFNSTLAHEPYVLSMSNTGPNTNGTRFCFTGNVTMASRDNRHTVFGKVLSPSSRAVIDSILAAGADATTLASVQVRRTDPSAVAFDESAVGLPWVQAVESPLEVVLGTSVKWLGFQPASSVLRAHQSTDLAVWLPHYRHMVGLDDALPGGGQWIDDADVPARFYNFSLVTCPDAGGVTGFANRTLTIDSPGVGTVIYRFNSSGTGGTYENIVFPDDPPFFSGSFQVRDEIPAVLEPYSFTVLIHANGLGGSPFNLIRGGLDSVGATSVSGHHVTRFLTNSMSLVFEDAGILSLGRP
jgi:cyclophilin family peptidyl-prolyl cis-trans isomerase